MKTFRTVCRPSLALLLLLTTGFGRMASAADEKLKKPQEKRPAPDRLVITGESDKPVGEVVLLSSVVPGRTPMAQDASGTRRRPDEPRFITGSFVPQKIEVYGNVTTASVNLRLYDQGDLRTGKGITNGPNAVAYGASYTDTIRRIGNRYVLDLRTVAPERRLTVATQLLGPERGRQLVADFNRWQAIQSSRSSANIARR